MAKLDYYCIHTEAANETNIVSTDLEANFICSDHLTILECCGLRYIDFDRLNTALYELFANEINCTYKVEQSLDGFTHNVTIFCDSDAPSYSFVCNEIKITEQETW